MRADLGVAGSNPICLNREVVDFIDFLKQSGARVMALSDRPVEAAVIDEDEAKEDLMAIPMNTVGVSIKDLLQDHV